MENSQHDFRFGNFCGLFNEVPEFYEEMKHVNSLSNDKSQVEWGLQPAA